MRRSERDAGVPEPDRPGMLRILRRVAPQYEAFHGVTYANEALEAIYDLARVYLPDQSVPAKGIDLLDEVGVSVKLRSNQWPEQLIQNPEL